MILTGTKTVLAFCTIITKNYLAQARVLGESLKAVHPGSPFYVLVVDNIDNYFDPSEEAMRVVPLGALNLTAEKSLCFKYGLVELCTAVKPHWMEYLIRKTGVTRLVYLDPDICVYSAFENLEAQLEKSNLVLTPYITFPYSDSKTPNEINLLLFGTFNLGFLAISKTEETLRFLQWWKEKLSMGCRNEPALGYFVDQRWMDLAPSLFTGVLLLKNPGYNVAHWNLHYRQLLARERSLLVNGSPLVFMHFSGFRPLVPEQISVHQDRFSMDEIGEWKPFYLDYAAKLKAKGYSTCYLWPYSFAKFDNGEAIPATVRNKYLEMGPSGDAFGDPFLTEKSNSLYRWWKTQPKQAPAALPENIKQRMLDMACIHVQQTNSNASLLTRRD